jgi:hypothetical protein
MPGTEEKEFTGPRTRDYYQQSDMSKILGGLAFSKMAGPAIFGGAGQQGLLNFLTGASRNIDVGGGRTIEFDRAGNPTLKGDWENVSGDLAGTLPSAEDFASWGFVPGEEGGYVLPADVNWSDWDSGGSDWWGDWGEEG